MAENSVIEALGENIFEFLHPDGNSIEVLSNNISALGIQGIFTFLVKP